MSLSFAPVLANAILDSIRLKIDNLAGQAVLRIYAGTVPSNAQATFTSEACPQLANFNINSPCAAAASANSLTFTNPVDVVALVSGTATFFRIGELAGPNGGTPLLQGTVSDSGGSGDLKLNKTAFTAAEPVRIVEIKFTLP